MSASGAGGGAATLGVDGSSQLAPLTVDFHEPGFVAAVNGENAFRAEKGFWFQLSDEDKQKARSPWGPANPQALNRYSYAVNNPVRYTDPTGHFGISQSTGSLIPVTYHLTHDDALWLWNLISGNASTIASWMASTIIAGSAKVLASSLPGWLMSTFKGIDLIHALLLRDFLLGVMSAGVTAAAIISALLSAAIGLVVLDALYGYQGVDISIVANTVPIVTPPTVKYQHGYWYNDKQICKDLSIWCPIDVLLQPDHREH